MIYAQISSGRGPNECWLAIQHIRRKMLAEWPGAKILYQNNQTYAHSCVVAFDGHGAEDYVRGWEGTIQWVCKNPLNARGRDRRNWYIGIKQVELPIQTKIEIHEKDLVIETMRASGKGGQHVNKTETKVRMTHVLTGIVVVAEHQRSQKQNLAMARSLLFQKLQERENNIFAALDTTNWNQHNQLERGNPIRVFDGIDFKERNR